EAIERVYYSHQIGVTKPFEEAVPRGVLERKVQTYLKQCVALEELWKTPVTARMLQREAARMAQKSRMPERLMELQRALKGDRFLFEETVDRAALADRLSRNFFTFDERFHHQARLEIERVRGRVVTGKESPLSGRGNISDFVLKGSR